MSFVKNWYLFLIFRTLEGAFNYNTVLTGFVYISEFVDSKSRGKVSINYQLCIGLGYIQFIILAYIFPNWRKMSRVSLILPLLTLIVFSNFVESPKYLQGGIFFKQNTVNIPYFVRNKKYHPVETKRMWNELKTAVEYLTTKNGVTLDVSFYEKYNYIGNNSNQIDGNTKTKVTLLTLLDIFL